MTNSNLKDFIKSCIIQYLYKDVNIQEQIGSELEVANESIIKEESTIDKFFESEIFLNLEKDFNLKNIDVIEEVIEIKEEYDSKGNAYHYNNSIIDTMLKFERTYGTYAIMYFCQITADKYRERIGKKKSQSNNLEITKMNWYEEKALIYKNKLGTKQEIRYEE